MKQRGAIVAGVIGADLPARVVLILGVVNVLADGFSMAAVNFSSAARKSRNINTSAAWRSAMSICIPMANAISLPRNSGRR